MTAEELARYRRSLDEAAARARSYVLRRLSEEGAGLGVAESRDLAIEVVEDATGVFGDQAQEVASELFDEVMEADGAEARATSFDGLIDHGRTEGKVHYYAGRIAEGDRAGFEARSADLAAYYVHRSAWENLVRNCDLNHVMWARVPTGRETCGWCYTLASRGFAYHSRESAMAGKHRGCDCVVVPGNADSEVEGLDLQWMRNCWGDCSDAVGGPLTREQTRELWDALDEDAKARWREKHGSKAYEAFHERKSVEHICAEVERRDAGWLYRGVEPPITFEDAAWEAEIRRARPWEIETAERLAAHGFRCDFWRDFEKWAVKGRIQQVGLPDLSNGYELKALRSADGVSAVNRAMRDAGHKKGLRCCVIDNSWGRLSDSDVIDEIIAHQRGRHVEDVLLVRSDGSLQRFINKEARAGTVKAQAGATEETIAHEVIPSLGEGRTLYDLYDVVETIQTDRGPVEVIRQKRARNNKRPEVPGTPYAIYATRSKTGRINTVYLADGEGIIHEEWNCGTHEHGVNGKKELWHKHIGTNPDHAKTDGAKMSHGEILFAKMIGAR